MKHSDEWRAYGGWTQAHAEGAINERLNISEAQLRERLGDDRKVDALIERFVAAMKADPAVISELYAQPDPYRWLAEDWAPKQRQN